MFLKKCWKHALKCIPSLISIVMFLKGWIQDGSRVRESFVKIVVIMGHYKYILLQVLYIFITDKPNKKS